MIHGSVPPSPYFREYNLVIEDGAYLDDASIPEILIDPGARVTCLPGSFLRLNDTISNDEAMFTELMQWGYSGPSADYMISIAALWDEVEANSVKRTGGKANCSPGKTATARHLKGFGGCRFVYHKDWACHRCHTWFPQEWTLVKRGMLTRAMCDPCGFLNKGRWRKRIKVKSEESTATCLALIT